MAQRLNTTYARTTKVMLTRVGTYDKNGVKDLRHMVWYQRLARDPPLGLQIPLNSQSFHFLKPSQNGTYDDRTNFTDMCQFTDKFHFTVMFRVRFASLENYLQKESDHSEPESSSGNQPPLTRLTVGTSSYVCPIRRTFSKCPIRTRRTTHLTNHNNNKYNLTRKNAPPLSHYDRYEK